MTTRALWWGLVLLVAAQSWGRAFAQPVTPQADVGARSIGVLQEACEPKLYDDDALLAALRVELAELGIEHVSAVTADAAAHIPETNLALLRVRCLPESPNVELRLAEFASGQQVSRVLDVTDVQADARPRALAMAVAVLLENAWSASARDATSSQLPAPVLAALRTKLRAVVPAPPPSPPPLAMPQRRHELRSTLVAAALTRAFPGRGTALLGVDFGYDPRLSSTLRLSLHGEGLAGRQEMSDQAGLIANMHLYWLTGGAALEWVSRSRPELSLGPIVRIGYAVADADAKRKGFAGKSVKGVVTSVGLAAALRAELSDDWDALVSVDFGYMPNGVSFLADLSRSAGMADISVGMRIGLAWAL